MALNRLRSLFEPRVGVPNIDLMIRDKSPSQDGEDEKLGDERLLEPGELSFAEDTSGGLGRHLGLFSTTFLM